VDLTMMFEKDDDEVVLLVIAFVICYMCL